jgi:lysozyme family protein
MSAANFSPSLKLVLIHEGGFVCDAQDPGGATCKGVTQGVYDDWLIGEGRDKRSVKLIDDDEIAKIYRSLYWDKVRGDALPIGVDYCCFDFAVNSGSARAARYLQRAAGVFQDGEIGPVTLAAVNGRPIPDVIDNICDARLSFLKQLPIFDRFGHGWTMRVQDVRAKAKEMAA